MTPDPDPKFDLDRLVALWSTRPETPAPAAAGVAATGASPLSSPIPTPAPAAPLPRSSDAAARLEALRASMRLGLGAESKELGIALFMIDPKNDEAENVPLDTMGIGDLVGAMFPRVGPQPSPKLLSKYSARMAGLLDDLEDLLDGLMIAVETRAGPG